MLKRFLLGALLVIGSSAHAEMLLFGGSGHDVFLGCVDCSPSSSGSICNEFGQYGSEFRDNIWNEFRAYGSEFRDTSPWNEFTTSKNVPVLVNRDGQFFGYFTINEFRSDAVNFAGDLKVIHENAKGNLTEVRELLCEALH